MRMARWILLCFILTTCEKHVPRPGLDIGGNCDFDFANAHFKFSEALKFIERIQEAMKELQSKKDSNVKGNKSVNLLKKTESPKGLVL